MFCLTFEWVSDFENSIICANTVAGLTQVTRYSLGGSVPSTYFLN